jgi:hypothetical protein
MATFIRMEVILTPEFKDLFPGETANVEELLSGVPSLLIIQLMVLINAELYSNDMITEFFRILKVVFQKLKEL